MLWGLVVFCLFAQVASAQTRYDSIDDIQRNAYNAGPQFDYMAREAVFNQPYQFDFTQFRRYYAETRQYDPIGDKTIDEMLEIAYHIQTAKTREDFKAYMDEYQNLLLRHLAHLRVVVQALSLSKTDKRFGNPKMFKWLKAGIIRDVMISGEGNTLNNAYDVITLTEETVLFNYLGLRQLKTTPNNEGGLYYNMHDVQNLKTGKEWTLFVNTSFPMKFLEAKAKMQKGFTFDLRRQ